MLIKLTNIYYLSLGVISGSKNCNGILLIVVTYCSISWLYNSLITVLLREKHRLSSNSTQSNWNCLANFGSNLYVQYSWGGYFGCNSFSGSRYFKKVHCFKVIFKSKFNSDVVCTRVPTFYLPHSLVSMHCIARGNWLLEINCDSFVTIRWALATLSDHMQFLGKSEKD